MADEQADTEQDIDRAARGDPQAREQLLQRYHRRLQRMLQLRLDKRLAQRIDPSDIIQTTLLLAEHRLDGYLRERPVPFYPWLRKIACEQLITATRRHLHANCRSVRREEQLMPDLSDESVAEFAKCLVDSAADPISRLVQAETCDRLHLGLNQLSETDRQVLILRYLQYLSTAETASVLGVGQPAVKMRHLRALQRLRRLLTAAASESDA